MSTLSYAPLLLFCECLSGCNSRTERVPPAARADTRWRPVALPARPLYMTSDAQTLWVCGVREMIAKSGDGGVTWQVKHLNVNGQVLLRVGFVAEKAGYAAGTGGIVLWTEDGGETWAPTSTSGDTILDVSFSDEKHGIRQTRLSADTTEDGGVTWLPVSALKSDEQFREYSVISGVATVNSRHSAILLRESGYLPYGDQTLFITSNGGKTWSMSHVPNVGIRSLLLARKGQYWAFGTEVVKKDQPGGGYGVPVALHSRDGLKWVHDLGESDKFEDYSNCNDRRCILWAAAKGNVCRLGATLQCSIPRPADTPWPMPQEGLGNVGRPNVPPLPEGCLVCPLDAFYVPRRLRGYTFWNVSFAVRCDGTVGDVRVVHATTLDMVLWIAQLFGRGKGDENQKVGTPGKEIRTSVAGIVEAWIFDPPRRGSSALENRQYLDLRVACSAYKEPEAMCILDPIPQPGR